MKDIEFSEQERRVVAHLKTMSDSYYAAQAEVATLTQEVRELREELRTVRETPDRARKAALTLPVLRAVSQLCREGKPTRAADIAEIIGYPEAAAQYRLRLLVAANLLARPFVGSATLYLTDAGEEALANSE